MAWLSTEFYYYPASAPCRAVHMTLKAINVDYEEKFVDLLKAENKRPWFVRLNPMQKIPVFSDQSYLVFESRAIMMYVCNKYCTEETQSYYPKDPETRGKVDKYLFFDMGTLSYSIKEYFKPRLYQGLPPDYEKENMMKQSLDYLDGFLEEEGTSYLCGENITIADISILASITELDAMEYNYKYYGFLTRYINRLKENFPYYKECCEIGVKMTKQRVKELEEEQKKEMEKEKRRQSLKK
ncbi:UNVERIFIED_CONTAM: hypothetical protein RMT77_001202 [Armadillidium vulgare]